MLMALLLVADYSYRKELDKSLARLPNMMDGPSVPSCRNQERSRLRCWMGLTA
jgi:hypothetical protein